MTVANIQLRTASEIERERLDLKKTRIHEHRELRYMTHAHGYVMVRHPASQPFVTSEKHWRSLPHLVQEKF